MNMRYAFAVGLVLLAVTGGAGWLGHASAQGTAQTSAAQGQPTPAQPGMAEMMKMREQMMAEMKAAETRLDALVSTMNAAQGDAKISAIAAVVTELVRQQKTMHAHMDTMHQQMMGGRGMMMGR